MATDINTNSPATNPLRLSNSRQQMADQRVSSGQKNQPAAVAQNVETQAPQIKHNTVAEPDPAQLESAVKDIEQFVQNNRRELRFSVDGDLGRTVVTILDSNDEVIRKIPSEEVLAIARQIKEASSDKDISLFSTVI